MSNHLDGITVVALEQAVAAPLCTSRLAADGARVIKIERAVGDFSRGYDDVVHGESAYFVWLNAGKESVVLDVKDSEDAQLLDRMIARADVFVQNLSPGAAARAGFGSDLLRKRYSRLITCDISGYGESGPWAQMKAYDFLIQCEAGLASVTGSPGEPARVGVSVADICCGMNAHSAILQALYHRERTGAGSGISLSLFDGMADWMAVPLLHNDYHGVAPARSGLHHPGIAPYGAYRTRDGKQIVFSVQHEREWAAFCTGVLGTPGYSTDPRFRSNSLRCANRQALDAVINTAFANMDREDVTSRLSESQIAYGALNDVAGLSEHPQLRRRSVETPTGPVRIPAAPVRWSGEARRGRPLTSPALDAHGDALRKEFE